jgi:hypothetical protein
MSNEGTNNKNEAKNFVEGAVSNKKYSFDIS